MYQFIMYFLHVVQPVRKGRSVRGVRGGGGGGGGCYRARTQEVNVEVDSHMGRCHLAINMEYETLGSPNCCTCSGDNPFQCISVVITDTHIEHRDCKIRFGRKHKPNISLASVLRPTTWMAVRGVLGLMVVIQLGAEQRWSVL